MSARWAIFAAAGLVGALWAGRTLGTAIPPEVFQTLPLAAQVAVGVVGAILVAAITICGATVIIIMACGGKIQ